MYCVLHLCIFTCGDYSLSCRNALSFCNCSVPPLRWIFIQTLLFLNNEYLGCFQSLVVIKTAAVNSQSNGYAVLYLYERVFWIDFWKWDCWVLGKHDLVGFYQTFQQSGTIIYIATSSGYWCLFTSLTNKRVLSNGFFATLIGEKWYLVFLLMSKVVSVF